jgi:hypothetical protein
MRIHQIATAVGVESRTVMSAAQVLSGQSFKSASTLVEPIYASVLSDFMMMTFEHRDNCTCAICFDEQKGSFYYA